MTRLSLLLALGLAACASPEAPPAEASGASNVAAATLAISDAYALPAPLGGTGALFVTIDGGAQPDTLVSVAFDGAARTDLHEAFVEAGGLHGMRPVEGLPVPAGATVALAPGGFHAMLVELARPLAVGDTLAATATFASGATLPVRATVRPLDALSTP